MDDNQLEVITYKQIIDFVDLFEQISRKGAKAMTIQSGGNMNATLLRAGLIDELSLVIAPVLVGGNDTTSLVDGKSLQTIEDLRKIKTLTLVDIAKLEHSYVHIRYKVN
jgi:2,5-diamino-6-(ribosylamino)-4(3H)-pyrimidinone 5'-phosphate reductase